MITPHLAAVDYTKHLGLTRDQLRSKFGEPDDLGGVSDRYPEHRVWKYGDIEYHFAKKRSALGGVSMICMEDVNDQIGEILANRPLPINRRKNMHKQTYTLKKDKTCEIIKEEIPDPVGDPLYEATMKVAEQNLGFIACGVQMSKDGDHPGEIMTLVIPK